MKKVSMNFVTKQNEKVTCCYFSSDHVVLVSCCMYRIIYFKWGFTHEWPTAVCVSLYVNDCLFRHF